MSLSSLGKKKLAAQVFLFIINITVIVLAARVNKFQDFFFFADLFPLGLSIATLILLSFLLTADLSLDNAYTGRAQTEIGIFGILSIFWLSFNAFSTSRWAGIPLHCDSIPADSLDERVWCKDIQALKGFTWVEFVTCFVMTLAILRYAVTQHRQGHRHIWKIPLSRYRPDGGMGNGSVSRDSEFFQYGRRFD